MRRIAVTLIQSAVLRVVLRTAPTIDLQAELHRRGWVSVTPEFLDHLKHTPQPVTIPVQAKGAWDSPLLKPGRN